MKHWCGKRTDLVHVETETRTLMTPVDIQSATNKTSETFLVVGVLVVVV